MGNRDVDTARFPTVGAPVEREAATSQPPTGTPSTEGPPTE
jgi:hypothetical protein